MNALDKCVMNLALEAKIFVNKFLYDEEGAVDIVVMVILIAIAVVLAVALKGRLAIFMETLFNGMGTGDLNDKVTIGG